MKAILKKKKVIVTGGGFAGIQFIRKLDNNMFDVLLIDKLNHHQFQPLFYQVATSQIEPSTISFPLRSIFRKNKNVKIRLAEVFSVDRENKEISTDAGTFQYDYLVIATGCRTNFFGNTEIERNALTLKTTYDAINIRNHILTNFEKALSAGNREKEGYMNLLIIGAGPTGVELAGAFSDIKRNILPKDYPGIDFSGFNVILVEGSNSTLNSMSDKSKKASMKFLSDMGVKIVTGVFLTNYDGKKATLSNGEVIISNSVIWSAGITGNMIKGLPEASKAAAGRIKVDRINRVIGDNNIFAAGDIAFMETPKYPKGHPQVANVAINQAVNLANNLRSLEKGKPAKDFEYTDFGSMATVGNYKAVVDFPFLRFTGFPAWVVWMFLHLMLILSVRNKLIVFIDWAWKFITKDTALRLILKENEKKPEPPPPR